ncbi:hypothetical protein SKAU_G00036740 [Synaphobranchus kaupii]|uniref:Uncharacterized protein n=1 Tax=Synaphobranchus kaupii TaxID=118154 RepID=A0A9Q1GGC4_SYNKA|nr:hypothetical protein SKAU_G00036740 [Synaphobranchus kaupii]
MICPSALARLIQSELSPMRGYRMQPGFNGAGVLVPEMEGFPCFPLRLPAERRAAFLLPVRGDATSSPRTLQRGAGHWSLLTGSEEGRGCGRRSADSASWRAVDKAGETGGEVRRAPKSSYGEVPHTGWGGGSESSGLAGFPLHVIEAPGGAESLQTVGAEAQPPSRASHCFYRLVPLRGAAERKECVGTGGATRRGGRGTGGGGGRGLPVPAVTLSAFIFNKA